MHRKSRRPLLAAALIVSLAAAGAQAAEAKASADRAPYMEKLLAGLPPKKAAAFRAAMKEASERNKEVYAQARQLRAELHEILVAPVFDKMRFIAKSGEIQQLEDKGKRKVTEAFAAAAAKLSMSERQRMADAMEYGVSGSPVREAE